MGVLKSAAAAAAAAVNKKLCNIKDIIDHCIDEFEKAYKGTVYEHISMLYHNGLTQWWTPESQAYIASRGWQYRQLCCRDPTNQLHPSGDPRKINRYRNKTIVYRPEFARGLDSCGFAPFKADTMYMRCLTSVYPRTDPRRFLCGTIPEVESTMRRCWTMSPTPDQIRSDILDFPRVLDIIVSVDGTVAPEISLRSGYRALKHDKSGLCSAKVKARQRIETLKLPAIHEDAEAALAILSGRGRGVAPTVEEVVELLDAEIDPEESDSEESERNDSDSEGCFYVDESSRRGEDLLESDFEEEDGNGDEGGD